MPAASASFSTDTSPPMAVANSPAASVPIQDLSTFAAVRIVPPVTTPGKVMPVGPVQSNDLATSCTTSATAVGVEGRGVRIFLRSASSLPVATSTGDPLMPLPPMSIPNACIPQFLPPGGVVMRPPSASSTRTSDYYRI
jgi:hypothetical protein